MAKTSVNSGQIRDEEVRRQDLNVSDTGDAVVARLIAGTNISFTSTGADSGTGDVTINATSSGGLTSLNGETGASQTFATGTSGTNFNISSASDVHTFNLPDASTTARGVINTGTQNIGGFKTLDGRMRIITSTVLTSGQEALCIDPTPLTVSSSGTHFLRYVNSTATDCHIDPGVTDSGYRIPITAEGFFADADFEGTLQSQYGIWSRVGHTAPTPVGSTINNSYGIYIETLQSGGATIGNAYGVFQDGTDTTNFFEGNLGIGVNLSGNSLAFAVNGDSEFQGNIEPTPNNTHDAGSTTNNFSNVHTRSLESNDDLQVEASDQLTLQATNEVFFAPGDSITARFTNAGVFQPQVNTTYDIGATGAAWNRLYINEITLVGNSTIGTDTSVAPFNRGICISGSDSASAGESAYMCVYGVNHPSTPGELWLTGGVGGSIQIRPAGTLTWEWDGTGITPVNNNAYDVGSSTNNLRDVYTRSVGSNDDLTLESSSGSGEILFRPGNATVARWTASGQLIPELNSTYDIGSDTAVWDDIFVDNVVSDTTSQLFLKGGTDICFQINNSTEWVMDTDILRPEGDFSADIGNTSNHIDSMYIRDIRKEDGTATPMTFIHTDSSGEFEWFIDGTRRLQLDASSTLQHDSDSSDTAAMYVINQTNSTTYANDLIVVQSARAATNLYNFIETRSGGGSDIEHRLRGDGNGTCDGSWTGGGADYAEYFESTDGTALPVGETVVLVGNKVRLYNSGTDSASDILGVVRPKNGGAAVVGNHPLKWHNKYLRDDFGAYVLDGNGDRQLNPAYDSNQSYIERCDRDEWNVIGMLGQIAVSDSATKHPDWIEMSTISASTKLYLVK